MTLPAAVAVTAAGLVRQLSIHRGAGSLAMSAAVASYSQLLPPCPRLSGRSVALEARELDSDFALESLLLEVPVLDED